ncbi:MAG: peptidase [Lachnospiraceae bacterium]|nr:peptidase [Lachnospiraceae bacterium]
MDCRERILSNDYADILVDFTLPQELNYEMPGDFCYHRIIGNLGVAYVERSGLPRIDVSTMNFNFLPKAYGLMEEASNNPGAIRNDFDTVSLLSSGILQMQGQPLYLTGRDVTIAVIGTGIQYTNPVFRDVFGRSRVKAIWDQTIQTGALPDGFSYGSEYNSRQIQEAIESDDPMSIVPSTDTLGHGTAMAAVAAGSRLNDGIQYVGAAPEANIVVVKLKEMKPYLREYYLIPDNVTAYQETDIMQAIQYVQKFALDLYRPLVICMGFGTNLGDHTGSSNLGRYMNQISLQKSRVFTVSSGNEGNAAHHFQGSLSGLDAYRDVEIRVGDAEKGFLLELWGSVPNLFAVEIRSPGGEVISRTNPRRIGPQSYSFVFEKTKLTIDTLLAEQASGAELIRMRFEAPTAGIWTVRVYAEEEMINGRFDLWLPITSFLSDETYFLEPEPDTTITEPGNVQSAITATAYNDENRSVYLNAGRGFTRGGLVKPDISAPGVNVSTPAGKATGGYMAAALTAGGVAQIMQWAVVEQKDLLADANKIRNYLVQGATREEETAYPNTRYGYGLLDIQGTFDFLAGL